MSIRFGFGLGTHFNGCSWQLCQSYKTHTLPEYQSKIESLKIHRQHDGQVMRGA